jgi:hypothetical protein
VQEPHSCQAAVAFEHREFAPLGRLDDKPPIHGIQAIVHDAFSKDDQLHVLIFDNLLKGFPLVACAANARVFQIER